MNQITPQELEKMFHSDDVIELQEFAKKNGFLLLPETERFAPSIITRSELGLFGLSSPRFAARFYLANSKLGVPLYFVNARRLRSICLARPKYSPRRALPNHLMLSHVAFDNDAFADASKCPEVQIKGQSCIADCFLPVPDTNTIHHITGQLGLLYGETSDHKLSEGSPFVRHIYVAGGGLCAQAVCFMGATLMHRHQSLVHGILEITLLATSDQNPLKFDPPREMVIAGLTNSEMTRYFERANLNAAWQRVLPSVNSSKLGQSNQDCTQENAFGEALRAYLLSGMPIIIGVDVALMSDSSGKNYLPDDVYLVETNNGQSIYGRNNVDLEQGHPFPKNFHAVLLTGCSVSPESPFTFIIHDPLKRPFMEASTEQIATAAPFELVAGNGMGAKYYQSAYCFIPITPQKVKVPLGRWFSQKELESNEQSGEQVWPLRLGLLNRIKSIEGRNLLEVGFPESQPVNFRHLRLFQAKQLTELIKELVEFPHSFCEGLPQACEELKLKLLELQPTLASFLKSGEEHWLWIHCMHCFVWIWDAETEMPATSEAGLVGDFEECFLVCRLQYDAQGRKWNLGGQCSRAEKSIERDADNQHKPVPAFFRCNLTPSLITSISVLGLEDALAHWPHPSKTKSGKSVAAPRVADLYAFMNDASTALFTEFIPHLEKDAPKQDGPTQIDSAVSLMARFADDDHVVDAIANKLHAKFSEKGVSIGAMATFIPELTRESANVGRDGMNALRFLAKLSTRFRAQHAGHSGVVEIVTGSLVDGIWPGVELRAGELNDVHGASLLDWRETLRLLLSRIREVIERFNRDGCRRDTIPSFAIEMEPGPLYVLGTKERVEYLCDLLEGDYNDLSQYVGLNVDVGHWAFLAECSPEFLKEGKVFNRIVHAHVSDHANGHYSDGVPGTFHSYEYFSPWLKILEERFLDNDSLVSLGLPRYSGCVALELEGISHSFVQSGWESFCQLFSPTLVND